jgi:hypothetical protein
MQEISTKTKKELIEQIAKKIEVQQSIVKVVVQNLLDALTEKQ